MNITLVITEGNDKRNVLKLYELYVIYFLCQETIKALFDMLFVIHKPEKGNSMDQVKPKAQQSRMWKVLFWPVVVAIHSAVIVGSVAIVAYLWLAVRALFYVQTIAAWPLFTLAGSLATGAVGLVCRSFQRPGPSRKVDIVLLAIGALVTVILAVYWSMRGEITQ
jgi:uncharacterized membrane protein